MIGAFTPFYIKVQRYKKVLLFILYFQLFIIFAEIIALTTIFMKKVFLFLGVLFSAVSVQAKDYALSTPNSTLIISAESGKTLYLRYYGSRADVADVHNAGRMLKYDAFPAYGTDCDKPFASLVMLYDGDSETKVVVEKVERSNDSGV